MPLPQFKSEKEFREQFIAPFLAKRGLIQVNHKHGAREQGKDFYFADYDRFENIRFCAVQAKVGNIGSTDRTVAALLDQVQRCFTVRIRFHKDAHERRCSAVYVMTTGTISENARERITDWCHSEKFGDNVYFLDGETLDRLQQRQQEIEDEQTLRTLRGLSLELSHNITVCSLPNVKALAGMSHALLRTHSMATFLAQPVDNMNMIEQELLKTLKCTEAANMTLQMKLEEDEEIRQARVEMILRFVGMCNVASQSMIEVIDTGIKRIRERKTVSVEVDKRD